MNAATRIYKQGKGEETADRLATLHAFDVNQREGFHLRSFRFRHHDPTQPGMLVTNHTANRVPNRSPLQ
jgi:hypothetical protein